MKENILFDGNGSKEVPFLIKDVRDFLLLDFCQHNYFFGYIYNLI